MRSMIQVVGLEIDITLNDYQQDTQRIITPRASL